MDVSEVVNRAIKYLIEGLVVAGAAIFIPRKSLPLDEITTLALVAAAVFAVPKGIVVVLTSPPTFKLPATPAPPLTTKAPVVVEVEVVVDNTTKLLLVFVPIFVFA